jgi:hypothetical protein
MANRYFRHTMDFTDRFPTAGDNAFFQLSGGLVQKWEGDDVASFNARCQKFCEPSCNHVRLSTSCARNEVQVRIAVVASVFLSLW